MSKRHFQLTKMQTLPRYRLHLDYADGLAVAVDLRAWIENTKALAPLKDPSVFASARLGVGGQYVEWANDGPDLAADNLRNLAIEQNGGIGHERIWNWLHDNQLSLDEGAKALGISRRMLIYYRNGEKPIPRAIWLACLGWEAVRPEGVWLPRRIPSVLEYTKLHQ
ncbi:DUF2442 domain-containing protein [Pusillimonas sp. SM2304]|uniref:DUF2442 domain-containing protein n=1 Tax=Pusillimonas sp. SM2304 TaxID=3073241 RepID=UPI002876D943|nr:DUF2442 domain-containing protein [Pusillimonas sp. SM2304]MDS1141152.1 DUF2442 domain-containing protein [Pusillimonas sp. SM2304]